VAQQKRLAFRAQEYWGRPVPGFGDPGARLLLIGLAPAAHGGNRTGRMFTGDRSGDFLYAALHRAGFASQPRASSRDDGLALRDCYVTAAVRCAPPQNRPSPAEISRCAPFLRRELALLTSVRVGVCLGALAFRAALDQLRQSGRALPRPLPRFGHGVELTVPGITLLGCYHPSQQNTFTGRLTAEMIDRIFERARRLLEAPSGPAAPEPRPGSPAPGGRAAPARAGGERKASGWRSA
jgi:uracil-DNA glycosylase family 4